jgi:hypothetical protein
MGKRILPLSPEEKAKREKIKAELEAVYTAGGIDALVEREVMVKLSWGLDKYAKNKAETALKVAQDELERRDEGMKAANAKKRLERVQKGDARRVHTDTKGDIYDERVMQSIDDKAKGVYRDWETDEEVTDGRQPLRDIDIAIFDGMDTLYFGELVMEYTQRSTKANEEQREKEGYQRALTEAAEAMVLSEKALRKRYPQKKWRQIFDDTRADLYGRDPETGEIFQ